MSLLILIPAFNEAGNLLGVIGRIREVVPGADLLVVDDGSTDATARVARQAGTRVVSHPFNMGYGVAIQTGYKYALRQGYDCLVQIDGDGQHEPESILDLLAPLQAGEADFVLGSRFHDRASYRPPLARRVGMAFFRFLVRRIVGQPIVDCTSGFQAFNREVIRFLSSDLFPVDYPDADVLITLHRAGFRIREVAARMYANREGRSMHSGLKPLYYVFKMLLSIVVVMLRSRKLYRGGR
ncbi:glycosyltransferase family 2 protein [Geothermobacter hydrogeniphilus]|uniref:glycosyltransferase family 2 protein n=1 Tax=Geothermobacter hydrogeniphilus TaxID=1969733 RepID=UPI0022B93D53|nr:glycosyltransferase family 2 protein [Geothermobacter hydrogeniphilus]